MWPFTKTLWNPDGLHCYVTGGSQGLGLALAKLLVDGGAHITIVARTEDRLKAAIAELETVRKSPGQKIEYVAHALDTAEDADEALKQACVPHEDRAPDAIFNCAGFSTPRFFIEATPKELEDGMKNAYWLQAWTAYAGAKRMVRDGVKGKIVFVSSLVGFMSFVGYSLYAPGKHALRGLGESLRSEFLLYEIDVHTFFPATMYTPGYDNEGLTKPKITAEIESTDEGVTAEYAAASLLRGVERGQVHIAADFLTNIFRGGTRGAAPKNNFFVDAFFDLCSFIGVPIWVSSVDKKVAAHRQDHYEHLKSTGFLN